jgi:hypothetical protein
MTVEEQKTAFARAWLKEPDAYKAAFTVIADTGEAMKAASMWVNDTFVNAEKLRLLGELGQTSFLADKDDLCKLIWSIAINEKIGADLQLKAGKLYAEVRNFIEKPNQLGNQIVNNGVMIVERHGNDNQWERECREQQEELANSGKQIINAC